MENESFSLQLALLECSLQACALILLTLLIWDIWRSYKTSSHWVPITPVLLNTIVLLLLNDVAWDLISLSEPNTIWEKHILFDLSALVFPVYIAYVMPEAAGHGFLRMLPYNGAIGLSLGIRISSGLNVMLVKDYHPVYVDQKCNFSDGHHGSIKNWYIISVSTVLATNVILFLLLLFSTACVRGIALKSANASRLLWDKQAAEVPQSLKNKEEPGKQAAQVPQSLKNKEEQNKQASQVEYAVKVRWLQARSWRPDYVFATSVLSVIVGWLVNICVVAYVVKWSFMWRNHWKCLPTGAAEETQLLPRSYFVRSLILVERTTAVSLVAFIAIGLGTVSWRWLSAVYYFPRKHACVFMEDAWKPWVLRWRYYVDLHAPESMSRRKRKICHLFVRLPLLAMAWVAWQVLVTVGKVIWFLTEWLMVRWVRILVMDDDIWKLMYGRGKQENRLMDPENWRESCNKAANENGRVLLTQYIENGKTSVLFNSEELLKIIPKDKSFPDNIDNIFWQRDSTHIAVENNLSESGRPSFKMMMVSLLRIMMCLQTKSMDDDGAEKVIDDAKKVIDDAKKNIDRAKKNMDDAIKACRQAWNVLELVDYGEGVLDLVGFIAEREFEQLQMEWKSYKLSDYKRNGKFMPEKMKRRMEKALRRTDWPRIENGVPALGDWKEDIVDLHHYKACKDLIIHFRPCSEQQSTQHPCSQQQSTQHPCSQQSTQHQCSQPSTQDPCPGQSTQDRETLLACVMNLKPDVLQKAMGIVIRHAIVNELKPAILKKCNESNDIEILQSAFSIGQGQALLETCLRKDGDTPTDEGTSSRTRPIEIK